MYLFIFLNINIGHIGNLHLVKKFIKSSFPRALAILKFFKIKFGQNVGRKEADCKAAVKESLEVD